jgi:hypothetical protein
MQRRSRKKKNVREIYAFTKHNRSSNSNNNKCNNIICNNFYFNIKSTSSSSTLNMHSTCNNNKLHRGYRVWPGTVTVYPLKGF